MARAKGHCLHCKAEVAGAAITRHLQKCLGPGDARLVTITPHDGGPWWLCLAVEPTADLRAIDQVLRDTWLECCGHMSAFHIGDTEFQSNPSSDWGPPSRSMAAKVEKALVPGARFTYEYDFGSTTELAGVVAAKGVASGTKKVRILARNDAVEWPCDTCGKPAANICSCCGAMVCTSCDVPCKCLGGGREELSRVVNSPRMGVCGY